MRRFFSEGLPPLEVGGDFDPPFVRGSSIITHEVVLALCPLPEVGHLSVSSSDPSPI